jgi:chromosome segregation and condensation protein ScpB
MLKLRPSERLVALALGQATEPLTVEQIRSLTGIPKTFETMTAIRMLTALGMVEACQTKPPTYRAVPKVADHE